MNSSSIYSSPIRTSRGPFITNIARLLSASGKTKVRATLKPVIVKALSAVAAAMRRVGTPIRCPYPRALRASMLGITTAGDTPAITNLKIKRQYIVELTGWGSGSEKR